MNQENSTKRPNIIYILGDDHRADYLAAARHPIVRTPHLDGLAAEGVFFTNAICTSPACTPSRACHYLGQWERSHGVNFNSNTSVSTAAWDESFPSVLRRAGYFTGWVGKNHVPVGSGGYESGAIEDSFDYWYGNHWHSGFYPKEMAGGELYHNSSFETQVEIFQEGALNFLRPQAEFLRSCSRPLPERPTDRPFLLCVTFNLPHDVGTGTMQLRPGDDELYKSAYRDRIHDMPIPATYRNHTEARRNPKLPTWVYSGNRISAYDYVKDIIALRERQVRICQTVEGMDRFVGVLRAELENLGLADNTIIVFSTDHGIHHGEHGLGGKCLLYEQDLRIPLIYFDPRRKRDYGGRRVDHMVAVPDLAPTILEAAELPAPDTMQGTSLHPVMGGDGRAGRSELFCEQLMDIQDYPRSECLRTGRYKYIRYFRRTTDWSEVGQDGTYGTLDNYQDCLASTLEGEEAIYEELYDLVRDPEETTNLAGLADHTEELGRLRRRIVELGREVYRWDPSVNAESVNTE